MGLTGCRTAATAGRRLQAAHGPAAPANKAKAVEWATAFVQNNGYVFLPGVAADLYSRGGKQDDLADALLLIMYYLDTYSNQLINNGSHAVGTEGGWDTI